MLVALGLEACGETGVSTCLSMMIPTSDDEGSSGATGEATDTTESDVGPCLGQLPTTDDGGVDSSSSGIASTGGSDTSGGDTTGTGTTDGSDDGAETSTSVCLAPPPDAPPPDDDDVATAAPAGAAGWHAAFTRVAAKLPADVAARLSTKKDRAP